MDAGPSSLHLSPEDSATPVSPTTAGYGALYDILLRTGWCPHTIVTILKCFSIDTAAHLFSLPRVPPALRDHSECTQTRCTANDTQLAEGGRYNSAHWKSCGGPDCAFLGPDPQEVREIIESGGIPLLSIRKDDEGLLHVGVIRATVHSRLIAVSHVWSGGLGNPHENSLPECQLRRLLDIWPDLTREGEAFETFGPVDHSSWHRKVLDICREALADRQRFRAFIWLEILIIAVLILPFGYCIFAVGWALARIKKISKSLRPAKALFWIDTICIPVGENYHHLKMQAINRMAKTYTDAQGIVILDHELQQMKHKSMTSFETMGLLACSAWMSRCWTFQEAALAKYWLVQSEDGIWCPDLVLLRENFSSIGALSELRDFFLSVPRLRTEDGVRDFSGKSFAARRMLFLYVWNALCTRSTTKREDLISIISNLLGFRPAEILRIPEENRLPSLFCADDVLPLTLLCRDRPTLTNWSEAFQWLPSTIEETPLEGGGGMLWRRADQENFFVIKFGSSTSWNARLYFCRTPGEHQPPTLSLLDEDTGEDLKIHFRLADDMILPELDVCILFFGFDSYSDSEIVSGACLGVRYCGDGFRQLYYLCPVKCFIYPSKPQGDQVERLNFVAKVKREDLAGLTEFAIEYDFSITSTLSESRTLNGMIRRETPVICIFPLCVYSVCYSLFLSIGRGFDSSSWNRWWTGMPKRQTAYLVLDCLRNVGFLLETYFVWSSLRKAEFEGWYSSLYEDGTIPQHASLYIHYPPLAVYCILGTGLVSWPIYLLLESLLPEWQILREIFLVACEGEVGLLLLKWLLELYVLAAPRIINLPVLMAQTSSPLTTPDAPMSWAFKTFYAKSRLTRVIEGGVEWVSSVVRSRFRNPGASDLLDRRSRVPTTDIPPETSHSNVKKPSSQPPWEHNDVKFFEPSTKAQSLRFENSISALTPRKYADGQFDDASQYLSEVLIYPRLILCLYWVVILLIIQSKWPEVDDKKQFGSREDKIVTIIRIFFRIMAFSTTVLAVHSISAGFLRRPTHAAANARFSVHFGAAAAALLLSTCCPLALLWVLASSLPPLVAASSICAAFVIGGLALLWFVELIGPRRAEFFLRFDRGQEAIEECYRRVYAESRFTRWVKKVLRPVYVGSKNWRRSFAAWRQHPESEEAGYEEGSRGNQTATAAYTDDPDPERDLIQLEREDQ